MAYYQPAYTEHSQLLPPDQPPPYSALPPVAIAHPGFSPVPQGATPSPAHDGHSHHKHSPPGFWYVLAGVFHFFRHRHLWPPFVYRLPGLLTLSIFVLAFLFVFTYLPQVALLLLLFHGPLAWVNAAFMVLNEAAFIITFVAENFLVEESLVDTFDAVMLDNGFADLVSTAREIRPNAQTSFRALGTYTQSPYARFSCSLTCKFLLILPLNFIPVVGPVLFILFQGYLFGPLSHYRYFQLKGWNKRRKARWQKERVWAYMGFGIVHILFQTIPVLSILFLFTSATGAALWAADMERRERSGDAEDERQRLCNRF